jgi:hypothetical protein
MRYPRVILPKGRRGLAASRQSVYAILHQGEQKESDDAAYHVGDKVYRREELTPYEKGEEDVGGDRHVGVMRAITIRRGQRKSASLFILLDGPLTSRSRRWLCRLLRHALRLFRLL